MTLYVALVAPVQLAAQHTGYRLIDLGTLGGPQSFVNGSAPAMINNRGVVAGSADTSATCSYLGGFVSPAFGWEDGVLTNLGLLPGGCASLPNSINSKGIIVGSGDIGVIDPITGVPELRADLRYKGQIINLGTFGGTNSLANDVNSSGQVVGGAENTDPDPWNFGGLAGTLANSVAWICVANGNDAGSGNTGWTGLRNSGRRSVQQRWLYQRERTDDWNLNGLPRHDSPHLPVGKRLHD